jgi:hypothetical protein
MKKQTNNTVLYVIIFQKLFFKEVDETALFHVRMSCTIKVQI